MNLFKNKSFTTATLAALLAFSHNPLTVADDTEIFFLNGSTASSSSESSDNPNVLFIFDTSGSMDTEVRVLPTYVSSTDYGSSDEGQVYFHNPDFTYTGFAFDLSDVDCADLLTALENTDAPFLARDDYYNDSGIVNCSGDGAGPFDVIGVSANYHDFLVNAVDNYSTRLEVMQEAATGLVNDFSNLNFGFMRFDPRTRGQTYCCNNSGNSFQRNTGGYIAQDLVDISNSTNKTTMNTAINALTASNFTPLAETMLEAHKFFNGEAVGSGDNTNRDSNAIDGSNYDSPIEDSCQSNYIVYLTDGEPTADNESDTEINNLLTAAGSSESCAFTNNGSGGTGDHDNCLDELAGYMANFDYDVVGDADSDGVDDNGIQSVNTYTIGLEIDLELLQDTAREGGGEYYTANSAAELVSAFENIVDNILVRSSTFVAPAVSVNAFNSLQNSDEVYFALFEPTESPRWPGNIKKYRINASGTLLDADNNDAIDPTTEFFRGSSRSLWSSNADGNEVSDGGAAENLSNARTIYTYTGSSLISLDANNTNITNQMLGLDVTATEQERINLVDWARGYQVDNDVASGTNNFIGDPLHTRPAVVNYGSNATDDATLFAMTNQGYLHAIDTDNGSEVFAFIPPTLLDNLNAYFNNDSSAPKAYGLDGPMTIWRNESSEDDNQSIDLSNNDEHVYIYMGMRRGGTNYYALDVTNRGNPELLWTIEGGTGEFGDLGQTWSAPIRTQVNWNCNTDGSNCQTRDVLFFGGGYDSRHDSETSATTGDAGAAIYMVDARTGQRLWSAGVGLTLNLNMQNSIPSDLSVNDVDGDGTADVVFALDILGKLWRIDINDAPTSSSDFATGGEIADVSESGTLRRFYSRPDAVLARVAGRNLFYTIGFGSGYAANPRNTSVSDRFYVIYEDDIFAAPTDTNGMVSYTSVSTSSLTNITGSTLADPTDTTVNGFFLNLSATGEKSVRPSVTIDGVILFTTYLPETNLSTTTCGSGFLGSSRLYARNFLTGASTLDTGEFEELVNPGISPEPVLLLIDDSDDQGEDTSKVVCVGTQCFGRGELPDLGIDPGVEVRRYYWRENELEP